MGPKQKAANTENSGPVAGAKIATITIGPTSTTSPGEIALQFSLKVNLNCPLDIVLDHLRKQFCGMIEQKIREINSIQESGQAPASTTTMSEENVTNSQEKEKYSMELQQRLNKIKGILMEENIYQLELFDGTNPLLCQQRLKSLALEVMSHGGGPYLLGHISSNETGQPVSLPFSTDGDSKASSPAKKK